MTQHPHTEVFSQWNGKKGPECNIQFRHRNSEGKWNDYRVDEPSWELYLEFRVKPQPKLRPWNYEELKAFFLSGKCIRHKDGHIYRPTSVNTHGVLGTDKYCFIPEELVNGFTQEDGSPCGVME